VGEVDEDVSSIGVTSGDADVDVADTVTNVALVAEKEGKRGSGLSVVDSTPDTAGSVLSDGKIESEVGMDGLPSRMETLKLVGKVV
jgi:hypothetical protein